MSFKEVLEFLNIPHYSLYTLIRKKGIPAFKVGRLWRFDREEIRQWLERKKKPLLSK